MQSVRAAANVGLVLGALAVQAACVCVFTHAHSVCFLEKERGITRCCSLTARNGRMRRGEGGQKQTLFSFDVTVRVLPGTTESHATGGT